MDWLIENAIALLALIVAGWSAWYTKKYSGQQTEMQKEALVVEKKRERERRKETQKAKMEVEFAYRATAAGQRPNQIRLINRGKADAKNVHWTINDLKPSKYPDVLDKDEKVDHFGRIKSGTVEAFTFNPDKDSEKILTVNINWDDDTGKDNTEEFELWI